MIENNITRTELVDILVIKLHLDKHDALQLVTLFYETIVNALKQGEPVHLSGFGNFILKDKSARPGNNLQTGEPCLIEPRRVVTFQPGRKLLTELRINKKLQKTKKK